MSTAGAIRFCVALAATGLLAACSSGGSQLGGTTGSSAPTATSADSATGGDAPKVPAPLNVAGISTNACDALSSAQVKQFGGVLPGRQSESEVGPSCGWTSAAHPTNLVAIGVASGSQNGLNNIYSQRAKYKGYFEPETVDGYPAVYADTTDTRTSDGDCSLWVGVTDQLMVLVNAQLHEGPDRSNPCPVAKSTAAAMIEHLKGAA